MTERSDEERILHDALERAEEFKQQGNEAFAKGENEEAIRFYTMAIGLNPDNHVYYSNRSAAYLKTDNKSKALKDAEKCVELAPNWVKGYSRLGAAQHSLRRYDQARETYSKGLRLDPENKAMEEGLEAARKAGEEYTEWLKEQAKLEKQAKEREEQLKKEREQAAKQAAEAKAAADTAGEETGDGKNADDDELNEFFKEVNQMEEEKKGNKKTEASIRAATESLGTPAEQINRLLQQNYKWKNLNPFKVLMLHHEATQDDVKMRYRKLSTLIHPDKNPDPRARDAFEEVKKAYETLLDEARHRTIVATIEAAMRRVDKERKLKLSKGMTEAMLGPTEQAYDKEILKTFAENENRRKKIDKLRAAQKKREADQHEEEQTKLKKQFELEKSWAEEQRRDKRVSNWRDFQKGGKKAKTMAGVHGWKEETRGPEAGKVAADGGLNNYKKNWK